jgi:hypothetical protein
MVPIWQNYHSSVTVPLVQALLRHSLPMGIPAEFTVLRDKRGDTFHRPRSSFVVPVLFAVFSTLTWSLPQRDRQKSVSPLALRGANVRTPPAFIVRF